MYMYIYTSIYALYDTYVYVYICMYIYLLKTHKKNQN